METKRSEYRAVTVQGKLLCETYERCRLLTDLAQSFFIERIHNLIGRYTSMISHLPENFLTILDRQIPTPDRQQYAIWRDIVGGVRPSPHSIRHPTGNPS